MTTAPVLHDCDLEDCALKRVHADYCFCCGAGKGSASMHQVALDGHELTTCFRDHCQAAALVALNELAQARAFAKVGHPA